MGWQFLIGALVTISVFAGLYQISKKRETGSYICIGSLLYILVMLVIALFFGGTGFYFSENVMKNILLFAVFEVFLIGIAILLGCLLCQKRTRYLRRAFSISLIIVNIFSVILVNAFISTVA